MRRALRLLFNLAAGFSLLLLLAVLVLWPASYRRSFYVFRRNGTEEAWRTPPTGSRLQVGVLDGRLYAVFARYRPGPRAVQWQWGAFTKPTSWPWTYRWRDDDAANRPFAGAWQTLGVAHGRLGDGIPVLHHYTYVPCSYVALLMTVFPAARLWSWRKRRARLRNPAACRGCGYDLTGNVSGVCPECGTAVPSTLAAVGTRTPPANQ